jgi:hypothetical protein
MVASFEWSRILDKFVMFWRGYEAEAENILGGVFAVIARIAPFIGFKFASIWTIDIDDVAVLYKFPVGMHDLTPPKPNGPARLLGHTLV